MPAKSIPGAALGGALVAAGVVAAGAFAFAHAIGGGPSSAPSTSSSLLNRIALLRSRRASVKGRDKRLWILLSNPAAGTRPDLDLEILRLRYCHIAAADASSATAGQHSSTAAKSMDIIDRDVARTFAGSDDLATVAARSRLRRVLRAYAVFDVEVGYVQGMNFLCGFILAELDDEAEAFALLVRLLHDPRYHMRRLFTPDLPEVKLNSMALKHLLWKTLPEVAAHLQSIDVDPVLFFEWYFTLFTLILPHDLCVEVWDEFLRNGWPSAFRIIIALLQHLDASLHLTTMDFHGTVMALKAYQNARLEVEFPASMTRAAAPSSTPSGTPAAASAGASQPSTSDVSTAATTPSAPEPITDLASFASSAFTLAMDFMRSITEQPRPSVPGGAVLGGASPPAAAGGVTDPSVHLDHHDSSINSTGAATHAPPSLAGDRSPDPAVITAEHDGASSACGDGGGGASSMGPSPHAASSGYREDVVVLQPPADLIDRARRIPISDAELHSVLQRAQKVVDEEIDRSRATAGLNAVARRRQAEVDAEAAAGL